MLVQVNIGVATAIFNSVDDDDTGYLDLPCFDRFLDLLHSNFDGYHKFLNEHVNDATGINLDDAVLRPSFDLMDADGDQAVTFGEFWQRFEEVEKALGLLEKPSQMSAMKIFAKHGAGKDQSVSFEQFESFVDSMRALCAGQPAPEPPPAAGSDASPFVNREELQMEESARLGKIQREMMQTEKVETERAQLDVARKANEDANAAEAEAVEAEKAERARTREEVRSRMEANKQARAADDDPPDVTPQVTAADALAAVSEAQRQGIATLFKAADQGEKGLITIAELRASVTQESLYQCLGIQDHSRDLKQTVAFFERSSMRNGQHDAGGTLGYDQFALLCCMLVKRDAKLRQAESGGKKESSKAETTASEPVHLGRDDIEIYKKTAEDMAKARAERRARDKAEEETAAAALEEAMVVVSPTEPGEQASSSKPAPVAVEKRIAPDGEAYAMDEFKEFYGDETEWYWNEAKTFKPPPASSAAKEAESKKQLAKEVVDPRPDDSERATEAWRAKKAEDEKAAETAEEKAAADAEAEKKVHRDRLEEQRQAKEAKRAAKEEAAKVEADQKAAEASLAKEKHKKRLEEQREEKRLRKEQEAGQAKEKLREQEERVRTEKLELMEKQRALRDRADSAGAAPGAAALSNEVHTEEELAAMNERSEARQKVLQMSDAEILAKAMAEMGGGNDETGEDPDSPVVAASPTLSSALSPGSFLSQELLEPGQGGVEEAARRESFHVGLLERKRKKEQEAQKRKDTEERVSTHAVEPHPPPKSTWKKKHQEEEETEAERRMKPIFQEMNDASGGERGYVPIIYVRNNKDAMFRELELESLSWVRLMKILDAADKAGDTDGRLNWEEFKAVIQSLQKKCKKAAAIKECMSEEGTRRDQTKEEEARPEEAAVFHVIDADGSGGIDVGELCDGHGGTATQAMYKYIGITEGGLSLDKWNDVVNETIHDHHDVDDSGFLDWKEFVELCQHLRAKLAPGGG